MEAVAVSIMSAEGPAFEALRENANRLGSTPSFSGSESDASQSSVELSPEVSSLGSDVIARMSSTNLSVQAEPVYVTAAEAFAGISLAEAMPRHTLRLERERDAALKLNEPRRAPVRTFEAQPSLDSLLVPHKSEMEKAKEAAIIRNEPRKAPVRTWETQPSLDDILLPHKSEMEKAKEAAVLRNEPRKPPVRARAEQPPLESMLRKSYSLVEREKMAAAAGHAAAQIPGAPPPRRSRLQMEREAAARLEEIKKAAQAAAAEKLYEQECSEAEQIAMMYAEQMRAAEADAVARGVAVDASQISLSGNHHSVHFPGGYS